jgi:hypothetical protein
VQCVPRRRSCDQAGDACDHNIPVRRPCCCDTEHLARRRNDAVVGAEHCGAQPADSIGTVGTRRGFWPCRLARQMAHATLASYLMRDTSSAARQGASQTPQLPDASAAATGGLTCRATHLRIQKTCPTAWGHLCLSTLWTESRAQRGFERPDAARSVRWRTNRPSSRRWHASGPIPVPGPSCMRLPRRVAQEYVGDRTDASAP